MYNELKEQFSKNKSYVTRIKILREQYPDLYDKVKTCDKKIKALYDILHISSPSATCAICKAPTLFDTFVTGYNTYCSHKCSVSSSSCKEKRIATNLKRYGVTNPLKHSDFREKRKATMVERFGVEHALQSKELLTKSLNTYHSNTEEEKTSIKEKRKETILKKYGHYNLWETPGFREKIKDTNKKRWGVEWVQQNQEVLDKRKKSRKTNFLNNLDNRCPTVLPLFTDFTNVSDKLKWKCITCNTEFTDNIDDGTQPSCPTCYPKTGSSIGESEVIAFIDSLNVTYELHNRTLVAPKEIDIYIPEQKVAIEYCGLYWHSDRKIMDDSYHQKKWKICQESGVRLITIFEDEWRIKPEICKSRLKYALGLGSNICFARQTTIRNISSIEYKQFLETYHIQGTVSSKIKLGAFHDNNLVAVMGFGSKRKILGSSTKDNEYELLRFATTGNIPGIGSKLFKYFIKTYSPAEVISYCDLRWGTGVFYHQLGMLLEKTTVPNYWYSKDGNTRKSRYSFTKHSLVESGLDGNKTERALMEEAGYYRIYDCGNYKFIYRPS